MVLLYESVHVLDVLLRVAHRHRRLVRLRRIGLGVRVPTIVGRDYYHIDRVLRICHSGVTECGVAEDDGAPSNFAVRRVDIAVPLLTDALNLRQAPVVNGGFFEHDEEEDRCRIDGL